MMLGKGGIGPGTPVLIVDDDPFLADAFQVILEDAGFHVEIATTGAQAISSAKEMSFRLVITDLHLPDMQGDHLSRELKAILPRVTVMLLTGMIGAATKHEREPDKILLKPIDLLELLRVSNSLSSNR